MNLLNTHMGSSHYKFHWTSLNEKIDHFVPSQGFLNTWREWMIYIPPPPFYKPNCTSIIHQQGIFFKANWIMPFIKQSFTIFIPLMDQSMSLASWPWNLVNWVLLCLVNFELQIDFKMFIQIWPSYNSCMDDIQNRSFAPVKGNLKDPQKEKSKRLLLFKRNCQKKKEVWILGKSNKSSKEM
jgi:hypothetical protein